MALGDCQPLTVLRKSLDDSSLPNLPAKPTLPKKTRSFKENATFSKTRTKNSTSPFGKGLLSCKACSSHSSRRLVSSANESGGAASRSAASVVRETSYAACQVAKAFRGPGALRLLAARRIASRAVTTAVAVVGRLVAGAEHCIIWHTAVPRVRRPVYQLPPGGEGCRPTPRVAGGVRGERNPSPDNGGKRHYVSVSLSLSLSLQRP